MGEIVEFPSNGGVAGGYLVPAVGGAGPGVIVIQEWWGLVDHIKDVCERLSAEGFTALAPDLYHGRTVPVSEPDEARKASMDLDLEQAARDMGGAIDYLAAHQEVRGEGVAVVGFCMGGRLALFLATQRPGDVNAVVPYYAIIPPEAPQPDWSKLRAAVQGHYGTQDEFTSVADVEALEERMSEAGVDVAMHLYPGMHHAFFNDTRPDVYDEEAARLAWIRTLEFLRSKTG